ncbi:hypothetical protein [Lonepinella koalarum]|uniref:Uncharacterized protein n=1 Tax=Lonepinella koalarum TaxID=53417 RepID=A0A4R1KK31_9PAST|nr:hypothetical protein [Lonepinella koalarum]MDH2927317.1 hypothetical protein [Lonepinella koalarum]TCK64750.1 hypothetical protein EV692_2440 [Lonepinella koalarum]TFJ88790.1 hypothetical protein E0709_11705 [Lonepinella koalarum]
MAQKYSKSELAEMILALQERQQIVRENMDEIDSLLARLAKFVTNKPTQDRSLFHLSLNSLIAKVLKEHQHQWLSTIEIVEQVVKLDNQCVDVEIGDPFYMAVKRKLKQLHKQKVIIGGGFHWKIK